MHQSPSTLTLVVDLWCLSALVVLQRLAGSAWIVPSIVTTFASSYSAWIHQVRLFACFLPGQVLGVVLCLRLLALSHVLSECLPSVFQWPKLQQK